jgi:ribulose-5-phosphate 4-epimerase/fuculose-1-phosphate aldolase
LRHCGIVPRTLIPFILHNLAHPSSQEKPMAKPLPQTQTQTQTRTQTKPPTATPRNKGNNRNDRNPRTAASPDPQLIRDLVLANHILANEGVLDGYGHVSVRHDKNPERFLISQHRTPMAVKVEDVMVLDLDAQAADGSIGKLTGERFIHSEIYRARPDVMAVVHSHSPGVIPFGITGKRLKPVWHVSCFLGLHKVPLFEIRDTEGPATDLLILTPERGKALAASLKEAPVVLMRGHGSTTVGVSLKQAVFRAIYTEMNARLQLEAMKIGKVNYLTKEESATAAEFIESEFSVEKPWEYWVQRLRNAQR